MIDGDAQCAPLQIEIMVGATIGRPLRKGGSGTRLRRTVLPFKKLETKNKKETSDEVSFFVLVQNQPILAWLILMPGPIVEATTQLLIY